MPNVFTKAKRSEVILRIRRRGLGLAQRGRGLVVSPYAAQDPPVGRRLGTGRVHTDSRWKVKSPEVRASEIPGFVLISGQDGNDAQHYQEKQLRNALRTVQS